MTEPVKNMKVVPLRRDPSPEVVEMCEDLLALAKSGELIEIAFFGGHVDGSCHTGYSATEDQFRRLSYLRRLEHRLQVALD